jgi:hypothetical protein
VRTNIKDREYSFLQPHVRIYYVLYSTAGASAGYTIACTSKYYRERELPGPVYAHQDVA